MYIYVHITCEGVMHWVDDDQIMITIMMVGAQKVPSNDVGQMLKIPLASKEIISSRTLMTHLV